MIVANTLATVQLAANAVPQNIALPFGGGTILSVLNTGPGVAFIETSNDANSAVLVPIGTASGGRPVGANMTVEMVMRPTDTRIAAISASTSQLYFTRGQNLDK